MLLYTESQLDAYMQAREPFKSCTLTEGKIAYELQQVAKSLGLELPHDSKNKPLAARRATTFFTAAVMREFGDFIADYDVSKIQQLAKGLHPSQDGWIEVYREHNADKRFRVQSQIDISRSEIWVESAFYNTQSIPEYVFWRHTTRKLRLDFGYSFWDYILNAKGFFEAKLAYKLRNYINPYFQNQF